MTGAIKPNFITDNMPSLKKDEEAAKKGASVEERHYYALSRMRGWKQLAEFIDEMLGELDNLNALALEKGMGFEEIGQNSVVIVQTKRLIKNITNKVKDATEACEQLDEKE